MRHALYTLQELLAEWRRLCDQCLADIEAAREAGDLAAYRDLKRHWNRF